MGDEAELQRGELSRRPVFRAFLYRLLESARTKELTPSPNSRMRGTDPAQSENPCMRLALAPVADTRDATVDKARLNLGVRPT